MVVLGVTGGIGSGKSLAAEFFRSQGAAVIDADEVAREVMGPGSPVLAAVVAQFGREILQADGSLDRRTLSRRVFGDLQAVATLNALTHPHIMAEIERRLCHLARDKATQVACVVAPLLLEAGGRRMVDRMVVLWAREEERVRRVIARDGLSEAEVRQRMAVQMSAEEQVREADWVVDTSEGAEAARRQLQRIWEEVAGRV